MPGDEEDRRKSPSQETIENTVAIGKLTAISERTTNDVDRLVRHIEKILPIHQLVSAINKRVENLESESNDGVKPKTLRSLLGWGVAFMVLYSGWLTLDHLATKEKTVAQEEKIKALEKDVKELRSSTSKNKNQITYLKGRIKK